LTLEGAKFSWSAQITFLPRGTFGPLPHLKAIFLVSTGRTAMLGYALIVFAVGALGGVMLATYVLQGRLAPWPLSLLHAGLGAVGLVLLIYAALTTGISQIALASLVILVIAALGGFYLASIHLRGKVAERMVVFVHAGVAVVGFLTLLGVVFGAL
jgi:hypothetical protein